MFILSISIVMVYPNIPFFFTKYDKFHKNVNNGIYDKLLNIYNGYDNFTQVSKNIVPKELKLKYMDNKQKFLYDISEYVVNADMESSLIKENIEIIPIAIQINPPILNIDTKCNLYYFMNDTIKEVDIYTYNTEDVNKIIRDNNITMVKYKILTDDNINVMKNHISYYYQTSSITNLISKYTNRRMNAHVYAKDNNNNNLLFRNVYGIGGLVFSNEYQIDYTNDNFNIINEL